MLFLCAAATTDTANTALKYITVTLLAALHGQLPKNDAYVIHFSAVKQWAQSYTGVRKKKVNSYKLIISKINRHRRVFSSRMEKNLSPATMEYYEIHKYCAWGNAKSSWQHTNNIPVTECTQNVPNNALLYLISDYFEIWLDCNEFPDVSCGWTNRPHRASCCFRLRNLRSSFVPKKLIITRF